MTDVSKNYRPTVYKVSRWEFEHTFRFPTIKLIDYNKDWEQLEADPNPFAIVVMAHLKVQQLRGSPDLFGWKLRLVRMLYQRGYSRQDILELFRFLDWLIKLPRELEERFKEEWAKKVQTMPYVTTVERIARRDAVEEIILNQLKRRLGELEVALVARIHQLSPSQMQYLGEALLDFSNVKELADWLDKQPLEDRW